ncbi:mycofactocin-coupled SDR family oxidoreductase [Pseudonocardia sp. GCM10023141]|uniref:mycofactocin-coupled SDR family oxidoreductase n=1 Tax=Pseudonocardia sp. GCM10023141 TaxID=3252653 RepID=UPI003623476C
MTRAEPRRVALVTGAARGLGRAHAVRLAQDGLDVVAIDLCAAVETVPYPPATPEDLAETVATVHGLGARCLGLHADVRDAAAMEKAVDAALSEFGRIDVVVANAGVSSFGRVWELTPQQWREVVDVNLTGTFHTVRPVVPAMIEAGRGGSIVLISSIAGLAALPNVAHYTAAKHGVTGLMRSLAVELAPYGIRANSVHPTTADTPMVQNPAFYALAGATTREHAARAYRKSNALPVPWVAAADVSNAVAWLASDESAFVTGTALPVDAGALQPFRLPPGAA